ncbi:MAG: TfoX/Sxy family protein [Gammaproteobacteria bacterium]|nr:TfoX/Sxy family protein [Gammaproteobacteria bacterium]
MTVSQDYKDYVIEQLAELDVVRTKRMFGGVGIYSDDIFFALIENDTLRFKVDDSNKQDYIDCGMEPFKPYKNKNTIMSYYEVPVEILEDIEALTHWARKSIQVALNSRETK